MTDFNPDPVDIRLPLGGLTFSVRVAILCVRNAQTPDACLLANTEDNLGFWYLPGGALGTGETSESCAAREWAEETGTPPGGMQLVGIVENHFGPPDTRLKRFWNMSFALSTCGRGALHSSGVRGRASGVPAPCQGFNLISYENRAHEIGFFYRMEAPAELPAEPFPVLDNAGVRCEWIPLGELESRLVYPLNIGELLRVPAGEIRHWVVLDE
jgi:8-oxo-dGTP pyrophosphatase MutT (NUDIX family)